MKRRILLGWLGALVFGTMVVSAAEVATTSAPATMKAPPPAVAADQPSPRMDKTGAPDPNWMKRHDDYVALAKKGGVDLYFIGDSITDGWHGGGKVVWEKEFGGWKPGNFGIGGDQTQHVLWRLKNGELDGVSPKVFVIMIGTNNLGRHTNEEIAAANAAIVKELQAKAPQAKILLLGVFPRGKEAANPNRPRIKEINAALAKMDDGKNVKYLDFGQKFLAQDGTLPADVMPDALHPNEKGYQIWADAIKPVLTEWLGAQATK